jgi:hypothetical protein
MTYYGTQRNWWTRLIRLLITLHTITQHTMPVYDANRAQLQTNHHMMMGLGGGAKHASQNERSANKKEWSEQEPPSHNGGYHMYMYTRVPAYGPRRPCRCDIGAIIGADIGGRTVPLARNSRYRY